MVAVFFVYFETVSLRVNGVFCVGIFYTPVATLPPVQRAPSEENETIFARAPVFFLDIAYYQDTASTTAVRGITYSRGSVGDGHDD